jgi:hypothetical protein
MRFNKLTLKEDGKHAILDSSRIIERYLATSPFYWLLNCEVDDVEIEIDDNILYWKSGVMYWGKWQWGVFENGEFRSGEWFGGIWKDGEFRGTWHNGVWIEGTFKGKWIKGKRPEETK